MVQAIRQSIRALSRRPAFAIAAVVTLALGIGANTAVYRVIDAVLLRPLPYRDPAKLVQLWERTPVLPQLQIAVGDFEDWRAQSHSFSGMAAYTFQAINRITLTGQGESRVVQGTNVTPDLFSTMGIEPMLGRAFSTADDREKRNVALISEKLWRSIGADRGIVGRSLRLETEAFTVIGVVPTRQAFPAWADVWLPFSWIDPALTSTRKYHALEVIARLRPGVSEETAAREIHALAARLAVEHRETNATVSAYAIPLAREIAGPVRPALLLIWAAVGLVLLMACANLGHMLLARMLDRRQELAIRASLGAGRWQLSRLVFTESLLLAAAGGFCGALLASEVDGVLRRMAQGRIPRLDQAAGDGQMILFVLAVSFACAILFALPACAHALGVQAMPVSGRSMSRPRSPLSSALIAAEVAMAFVVLMGAALLVRSFAGLLNEDPGFHARGVLAAEIPLPSSIYDSQKAAQFLNGQVMPAVRALPGVEAVAGANCAPMSLGPTEHTRFATRFGIQGRTFEAGHFPVAQLRWVTPDYFRALGIPLRGGRWLTEADRDQPRFMINETLARQFFPHGDATGGRLLMNVMDPHPVATQIVGVAGDVRDLGLDEPAPPTLYLISGSPSMTLLVRTSGDTGQLAARIRDAIHRADSGVAVLKIAPVEQYVADSLAARRFALTLLCAFAGLAALLTAAGVYGLLAYSVSRRMREFGIRAALGATPGALLRMVGREAAVTAAPGLAAGMLVSLVCGRYIRSLVYRLSPADPVSLSAAALLLSAITLLSVWAPARRAARVEAGAALRAD